MKSFKIISLTAGLALACAPMVNAKMNGFGEETTCTQGGSTKPCHNDNGTETTTTGPKGQLQNDKDHNTTPGPTCGPGNSTGC